MNSKIRMKKTTVLMNRAEHEGMMYITPIEYTKLGSRNLSKEAFGIQFCNFRASKDAYVLDFTGSPSDIRKGIKYVEKLGIKPTYCNFPIMREGRLYNLFVDEGYWVVGRVIDDITADTIKPYRYDDKVYEFDVLDDDVLIWDDYDCEPEAIEDEYIEI